MYDHDGGDDDDDDDQPYWSGPRRGGKGKRTECSFIKDLATTRNVLTQSD